MHVERDPVFSYQVNECESPYYSGTNEPSDYDQKMTSFLNCHCRIPGILQRKACCVVDVCAKEDGFFSYDCGNSET